MSIALSAEPLPLELTELREVARVRLRIRGELDIATAATLDDRLRGLRARREGVLLDLDELAFIDASGLRVILSAGAGCPGLRVGVHGHAGLRAGPPAVRAA